MHVVKLTCNFGWVVKKKSKCCKSLRWIFFSFEIHAEHYVWRKNKSQWTKVCGCKATKCWNKKDGWILLLYTVLYQCIRFLLNHLSCSLHTLFLRSGISSERCDRPSSTWCSPQRWQGTLSTSASSSTVSTNQWLPLKKPALM